MVHPYLKRRQALKRGQKLDDRLLYPDLRAKPFLEKTLGVPLFQEQVLQIAIVLAGFTPGEADELRRAIGAWRAEGCIEKMGKKLMEGLMKNGLPHEFAQRIFQQIQGFSEYGFPESHAASFALLAYASAYLKCHHPAEFISSLINSQPMGFYSNHMLVSDALRHHVQVLPVHPNISSWDCAMEGPQTFRLGLRVVVGLSEDIAAPLIEERNKRPFRDLGDFLSRTSLRRDVLYNLAMGNAFACFGFDERHGLWQMLEYENLLHQNQSEQLDLFSGQSIDGGFTTGLAPGSAPELNGRAPQIFQSLDDFEKIQQEYQSYRLYTGGHPMGILRKRISTIPKTTSRDMRRRKSGDTFTCAGLVLVKQRPPTAKGVTFATLEDEFGYMDLILHEGVFAQYHDKFLNSSFLKATGIIQKDSLTVSMLVKSLEPINAGLAIDNHQYFDFLSFR
jgi:error-prone DNA polymerase